MGKKKRCNQANGTSNGDNSEDIDRSCFLCAAPDCEESCDHCGLVYYCGEAHRVLHRPENLCFPFRIRYKEGVGRFMEATRDIEPLGEFGLCGLSSNKCMK